MGSSYHYEFPEPAHTRGNSDGQFGQVSWLVDFKKRWTIPPPVVVTTPVPPVTGNTAGIVVGAAVATGGANEYSFNLKITSSTVSGVAVGQQIWVAATTTNFPNLLTPGVTLTGNLDKSLGWWVLKK